MKKFKLGVLGVGKMGSSILEGIEKASLYKKEEILLFDPNSEIKSEYEKKGFIFSDNEKNLVENVDILLTHDAPYGCSDICYESRWGVDHIGSLPLREAILEKKPKFCLHGHLHTSNHEPMFLEGTCIINTSISDESYQQVFKPLVLTELDLNYTVNPDLNDEEYIFPNRYNYLIRLRKTGVDYTLDLPKYCHFQASYTLNDDKTYYSFDPEGGPMLVVGSKWFDFTIKSIKEIEGELILEIEKDGILNKD